MEKEKIVSTVNQPQYKSFPPSQIVPRLADHANERTYKFLDTIDQMCETPGQAPVNIEAYTYLPDLFFKWNKNDTAWKWMKHIIDKREESHELKAQGSNRDYPEISFTLVSQVVEGLMGVTPDAPTKSISL